eukprot:gene5636-11373_t
MLHSRKNLESLSCPHSFQCFLESEGPPPDAPTLTINPNKPNCTIWNIKCSYKNLEKPNYYETNTPIYMLTTLQGYATPFYPPIGTINPLSIHSQAITQCRFADYCIHCHSFGYNYDIHIPLFKVHSYSAIGGWGYQDLYNSTFIYTTYSNSTFFH